MRQDEKEIRTAPKVRVLQCLKLIGFGAGVEYDHLLAVERVLTSNLKETRGARVVVTVAQNLVYCTHPNSLGGPMMLHLPVVTKN